MHSELSILIQAPRAEIFRTAADLEQWPEFLPHYIRNHFTSGSAYDGIVDMSCRRPPWVLKWTSQFRADPEKFELHFHHLRPTTRGMIVIWTLKETPSGVEVRITHDFTLKWPLIGGFVANWIIGRYLIDSVATRTLRHLKQTVESRTK